MNTSYFNSPFEQYRTQCEQTIHALDFPQNFYKKWILGNSIYHNPIPCYSFGIGNTKILLTGGVHGREAINSFSLLSMLVHYASHFTCYSNWFSTHTLYLIPMLNPDGYVHSLSEPLFKNNGNNVDINRNFPCKLWQKKWANDTPASEIETQVLIHFFEQYSIDYYFDIHSRGKGVYYYRHSMPETYNVIQKNYGEQFANFLSYQLYSPIQETNVNDTGGNTVQFFAETYRKPAFTIETLDEKIGFPIPLSYVDEIFHDLVNLILLL